MKGGQSENKTKVVIRHLPPGISQAMLVEQIDGNFSARYRLVSFRPGKSSLKHQSYSRAYIEFNRPEDVFEFADFFNGHLFVNEKGTQFRAIVEYAPSQRVPKNWSKKDGREGSIFKDPEYLEFLQVIAKPVENLPSAEIQLERREAEKAGAVKEAPIVTPLMDFVRQKRAAKSGNRRILSNGKLSRRGATGGSPSSSSSKRGSEKKRTSTVVYVLRDNAKSHSGKQKSTYILASKRDDPNRSTSASGPEALEDECGFPLGISGITDAGKKKILLLKGKEKEISPVSGSMSQQQNVASSDKSLFSSTSVKQSPRREGRSIRSILLNKDSRQNQSVGIQSEQNIQMSSGEKDKRPPRPPTGQFLPRDMNGASDDKVVGIDFHVSSAEKPEKRVRNKDRPDRVVWTPLRRSDGSYASDESLSSQSAQSGLESSQGNLGDVKTDVSNSRSDVKNLGSGRNSHSSVDNGSHKHFGRRGPAHIARESDGSLVEGKPSKRSGSTGFGSHEKQVWVQKSSSGS